MESRRQAASLPLLTLQEALDLLGVSRATVDRWRQNRGLPCIKIGREVYFDEEELQRWIRSQASVRDLGSPGAGGEEPLTLTLGYQSGTAHMWSSLVIKGLRLLEDELSLLQPARRIAVRWRDAASGLELVEELIAGQVQIAALGDYPIAMSAALSRVLPRFNSVLLALDGKAARGRGIALAVPRSFSLRSLSDLAAHTVATVPHSSADHRLQTLLAPLGTRQPQVIHQQMPENLRSIACESVGASVMWEPYPSLLDYSGQGRLLFAEGLGGDYLTGLAADQTWVTGHEDIVIAYLKAHLRAHALLREQPGKMAKLVAREASLPLAVASQVLSRVRWDAAVYTRDLETLQGIMGSASCAYEPPGSGLSGRTLMYRGEYLQEAARRLRYPAVGESAVIGDWSERILL
ncbi:MULTISPECIES: helix-turn-helix domain-containing protein [Paenibacillus]|uniref:helix-turn-helix domain-containing protein n=1 Tax=Paenibacillus TaxID=44249 RepID=UPI0022B92A30|nr:helix-turn-helix domain-containing protein [Paenibacillus caseinilyticus]MCZ8521657.1 helix-turn-helix domain-containing protein [Paenibacillus caseinilyticus]